jgi:putative membrane protein
MAKGNVWKGVLAGAAGGLAGTVAMTQFQNLWSKASEQLSQNGDRGSSSEQSEPEKEDATMKAAGKLAELARQRLSRDEKKKLGPIVHYAFGAGMGALYGALVEVGPRDLRRHDLLSGLGFGSVLFAGADEVAVPALGLSANTSDSPMSSHLYALASHIVYGVTAGAVRKAVRKAM